MADPLVEYLVQQQRSRQAQNPFNKAAAGLSQMNTFMPQEGMGTNAKYGAIKAIAESVFEGLGERRAEQDSKKDFSDLTNALQTGDFGASPELSKFGQLYNLQQAQAEHENKLAQALIEQKMKYQPPEMQNFIEGTDQVQKQWDPSTQSFTEVGRGPRYKFSSISSNNGEGDGNQTIADLIPSLGLSLDEEESARAAIAAAANFREARLIYNSLQRGSIEKERRENRPVTPDQTQKIASMSDFTDLIDEALTTASGISDNRLWRYGQSALNTDSPDFKLKGLMSSLQQAYARAKDSGALSKGDIDIFKPVFGDFGIMDNKETLIKRLNTARERAKKSFANSLASMKNAGFNVKNFLPEDSANSEEFGVTLSPDQVKELEGKSFATEEDFKDAIRKVTGAVTEPDSRAAFVAELKAKGVSAEEGKRLFEAKFGK